jgi:hypothetical protein
MESKMTTWEDVEILTKKPVVTPVYYNKPVNKSRGLDSQLIKYADRTVVPNHVANKVISYILEDQVKKPDLQAIKEYIDIACVHYQINLTFEEIQKSLQLVDTVVNRLYR